MKPIMFTESNFVSTINGIKTNTRRLVPTPPGASGIQAVKDVGCSEIRYFRALNEDGDAKKRGIDQEWILKPRYQIGEKVYIQEPVNIQRIDENHYYLHYKYSSRKSLSKRYVDLTKSDVTHNDINKLLRQVIRSKSGFCNKMFMPCWAARHFIKITDVRCERLQDITESDCFKEGIEFTDYGGNIVGVYGLSLGEFFTELGNTPREAYATEIDQINGKGTWDSNPFVYSYYYELITLSDEAI